MPYSQLSVNLPKDLGNRSFVGPNGKVPKGVDDPGNPDQAVFGAIIYGPDGNTIISTQYGLFVQGPDNYGSTANAKPLQMGGVGEATVPTAQADGQVVRAFFDLLGQLAVRLRNSDGSAMFPDAVGPADALSNATNLTRVMTQLLGFNGTSWDRLRSSTANGLVVDVSRVGKVALSPQPPTSVSVGTSTGEVLAANSSRKGLIITNTSTTATVSLAFGISAQLNKGLTLLPGATWNMGEYDFTTAQVQGIASAAATNVSVQEFA